MENLIIQKIPPLKDARMLIGLSGWMDGGNVSTGTVGYIMRRLASEKFAEINPRKFYVLSFPGTMRETAHFRPHCRIENGIPASFQYPRNHFFYNEDHNLILFVGKEPNLHWNEYAKFILRIAEKCGVRKIYFAEGVKGSVPHTRDPRLSCYTSSMEEKKKMESLNVGTMNYEGPASITALLTRLSAEKGIDMTNLIVEIPAYLEGRNPKGIREAVRIILRRLGVNIDLEELSEEAQNFEKKVERLLTGDPELSENVKELEKLYDRESLLKWLRKNRNN